MKWLGCFSFVILFSISLFGQENRDVYSLAVRLKGGSYIYGDIVYENDLDSSPNNGEYLIISKLDTLYVFSDSEVFYDDNRIGVITDWNYIIDSLLYRDYDIEFCGGNHIPKLGCIVGDGNVILYYQEPYYPRRYIMYACVLTKGDLSMGGIYVGMDIKTVVHNVLDLEKYSTVFVLHPDWIKALRYGEDEPVHRYCHYQLSNLVIRLTIDKGIINGIEYDGFEWNHPFRFGSLEYKPTSLNESLDYILKRRAWEI